MKINKDVQYALLFALYLSRSGRVSVRDAAASLGIPGQFMSSIANKLRRAQVISSVRGPGGGYELRGDPTVLDVWNAVDPLFMLKSGDSTRYATSPDQEHRALLSFVVNLRSAVLPLLRRKIKSVSSELVANELAHMERISIEGVLN